MRKNQRKLHLGILFAFLLTVFSAAIPVPVQAGLDAYPYPLENKNAKKKTCNVSDFQSKETGNRWWKTPFKMVSDTAVEVADTTFSKVAGGAVRLAMVGMGLWLAVFTLKVVGSMVESDPMDNMTKIGGMMLKVGIAVALLQNKTFFFSYFVAPITAMGAGFAGLNASGDGIAGIISPLEALMEDMHVATTRTQGLGKAAMCISDIWLVDFPIIPTIGPIFDPGVWANGCLLKFGAWILMMIFPIFIFDALFRIGVTAALCPLFIVAWIFPSTASFAQKGLNSFLNVAFFFLCLKIALDMALALLVGATGLGDLEAGTPEAIKKTICMTMVAPSNDNLRGHCHNGGKLIYEQAPGMFIFIACVAYGWLFLKQATVFANYFSDASFSNDTAFQATKGAAGMVQGAAKAGIQAGTWADKKISQGKDKKAARTVERSRQSAAAAKSGAPYTPPSAKEQKKLDKAESRLKNRGYLKRDGSETQAYGDLLQNGKRRWAMNRVEAVGRGLGVTDSHKYDNMKKSWGGARSAEEVNDLNSVSKQYGGTSTATPTSTPPTPAPTPAPAPTPSTPAKPLTSGAEMSNAFNKMDSRVKFQKSGNASPDYYSPTSQETQATIRMREAIKGNSDRGAALESYSKTAQGKKDMDILAQASQNREAFEKKK